MAGQVEGVADEDGLEEGEIDDEGELCLSPVGQIPDPRDPRSRDEPADVEVAQVVLRRNTKPGRRKRSLEEALKADEEKKKRIEKKLKALEDQMGAGARVPGASDGDVCHAAHAGENHGRHPRASRKRKVTRPCVESSKGKPRKRCRVRQDKKGRSSDSKVKAPESRAKEEVKAKYSRPPNQCRDPVEASSPPIMELCKFYLLERCAKKENCLYLHKGFPCKFHHTGMRCKDTAESCKFSHEQLNDTTRKILLKHLETAPNDILGDFPRHDRESALAAVFQTEVKHKGWDAEQGVVKLTNSPSRQNQVNRDGSKMRASMWDNLGPDACLPERYTRKGLLGRRPGSILGRPPLLTSKFGHIFSSGKDQLLEKEIPNLSECLRIKNQMTSNFLFETGNINGQLKAEPSVNTNTSRKELMTGAFQSSYKSELNDSDCLSKVPKPQEHLFDRIRRFQASFQDSLLKAATVTRNASVSSRIDESGCNKFDSFDEGNSLLDNSANFGLIIYKPEQMKTIDSPNFKVQSFNALKPEIDIYQKMPEMDPSMLLEFAAYEEREPKKEHGLDLDRLCQMETSLTEIDASIHAHPRIRYKLIPILILEPDYSTLVGPSSTRVHHDPRLSRYSKKRFHIPDLVSPSTTNSQQKKVEYQQCNQRLRDSIGINLSRTAPIHFECVSPNLDAEYQNRSRCLPLELESTRHSPQDNQHHLDFRGFGKDSLKEIRIGEQNDLSGPRGGREPNHQNSFFASQASEVSRHGLRNSLNSRDPRYHQL